MRRDKCGGEGCGRRDRWVRGGGEGVSGEKMWRGVAHEAAEMLSMAQSASCCSSAEPEESIRTKGGSTPARTWCPNMETSQF